MTLVSGPVNIADPHGVNVVRVETAREMLSAVEQALPVDCAVFAAAVADWRVAQVGAQKIKKAKGPTPALALTENPDILATISHLKDHRPRLVVGFAAETEKVIENAQAKLARKGCDWILANDVSAESGVMGGDQNHVHLISRAPASKVMAGAVKGCGCGDAHRPHRRHPRLAKGVSADERTSTSSDAPAAFRREACRCQPIRAPPRPASIFSRRSMRQSSSAPGTRALIPTGLAIALPAGTEGQVRPRSGLAAQHGITVLNSPGTIDADYRGEIRVILVNLGQDAFTITRGMRIAQLIVAPVLQVTICETASLDETTRGVEGFGSTGTSGMGPA